MKNVLCISLLSVLLLTTACQPKDSKIETGNANTNNGLTIQSSDFDSAELLSLTIDRQVEALHLLKALLNPDYAAANKLAVTGELSQTLATVVSADGKSSVHAKAEGSKKFEYGVNYQIIKLEKNEIGAVTEVVLKNNSTVSMQSKGVNGKTDVQSKARIELITIKSLSDVNNYSVSIDRLDETNSLAEKKNFINISISYDFKWDGMVDSLNNELIVKTNSFYASRVGTKNTELKYRKIEANLAVKLDQCISINGSMKLVVDSKDRNLKPTEMNVVLIDSSFGSTLPANGASLLIEAASCENRPVVDLTKLL